MAGYAQRSFYLNGSSVNDPVVYNITPSGGVAVSGSAGVVAKLTQRFEIWPSGGVKVSGAAAASYNWVRRPMSGGAAVSGAATVAFSRGQGVGSIAATLPKLRGSISDGSYTLSIKADLTKLGGTSSLYALTAITLASKLPKMTPALSVTSGTACSIHGSVPSLKSSITGGYFGLSGKLPTLRGAITSNTTLVSTITARLPALVSQISGQGTKLVSVKGTLKKPLANLACLLGSNTTIAETLPKVRSSMRGVLGTVCVVNGKLPRMADHLEAYSIGQATASARLPRLKGVVKCLR